MAIVEAERMKNSCVKTVLFACVLIVCVIIVGVLWYNYPQADKCSDVEVVSGVIVFKQLGLAFVYNPELLDWPQAHEACIRQQGHLAFPHSTAEARGMMEIMRNHSVRAVHAGFHDLFVEKDYVTVIGESLKEVGYQVKMPDTLQGPEVNCGKMANNALVSMKCSERLPSICRYPMWLDYTPVTGFGYYKLHTNATTWTNAWATCRNEGSYLLILRSESELRAMLQALANVSALGGDITVHYGAYKIFAGVPITIFDEPVESSGYSSWDDSVAVDEANLAFATLHLRLSSPQAEQAGALSLAEGNNVSLPFVCKHNLH